MRVVPILSRRSISVLVLALIVGSLLMATIAPFGVVTVFADEDIIDACLDYAEAWYEATGSYSVAYRAFLYCISTALQYLD